MDLTDGAGELHRGGRERVARFAQLALPFVYEAGQVPGAAGEAGEKFRLGRRSKFTRTGAIGRGGRKIIGAQRKFAALRQREGDLRATAVLRLVAVDRLREQRHRFRRSILRSEQCRARHGVTRVDDMIGRQIGAV